MSESNDGNPSRRYRLMIPGPVDLTPEVLVSLSAPVQADYGSNWPDIYLDTTRLLKTIFGTSGDVFILVGSGSSGIDACIGSALKTGEKIIIGINGFFGERMKEIAESYGLEVIPIIKEWGEVLDPRDFEFALKNHQDAVMVALPHIETSTTVVNPIAEIGKIVRKYKAVFMVDAVSSLGGMPFYMDSWGIDICSSASQKCLGGPPGLSPVAIGSKGWDLIQRSFTKDHGWYLNLATWKKYSDKWMVWHPFPITMATSLVVALRTSIEQILKDGIDNRFALYRARAMRLRFGLLKIGLQLFVPDDFAAPVVTAVYGYPDTATSLMIKYIEDKYYIKIAGGLGLLKEKIMRIGHMSPMISESDIDDVVSALERYKSEHNIH